MAHDTPKTDRQTGWAIAGHYGPSASSDLYLDPKGPFVHAMLARELERESARLRNAIQTAIDYANGRESEWGERAEGAFAVLYSALANVKDELRAERRKDF